MGFDEFEDMAPATVTVEPFASADGYNVASYGDAVSTKARVQYGPRRIIGSQGEEIVSSARVYLGVAVGPRDRITIPGAVNATPRILRVDAVQDEAGAHHWCVYT